MGFLLQQLKWTTNTEKLKTKSVPFAFYHSDSSPYTQAHMQAGDKEWFGSAMIRKLNEPVNQEMYFSIGIQPLDVELRRLRGMPQAEAHPDKDVIL